MVNLSSRKGICTFVALNRDSNMMKYQSVEIIIDIMVQIKYWNRCYMNKVIHLLDLYSISSKKLFKLQAYLQLVLRGVEKIISKIFKFSFKSLIHSIGYYCLIKQLFYENQCYYVKFVGLLK